MNKVATTPTTITGKGTYDGGNFPIPYDKTEHFEVSLSFFYGRTYVTYVKINHEGVATESTNCPIERVKNKEILEAANSLLN